MSMPSSHYLPSKRGGLPYLLRFAPVRIRPSEGGRWAWSVRRLEILPFPRLFGVLGAQQQRRQPPSCMTFYASTLEPSHFLPLLFLLQSV
jgi:hypothetical protein